ncbi:MAG: alpha/beta hydrolase family protein [Steroidobacter sp.]
MNSVFAISHALRRFAPAISASLALLFAGFVQAEPKPWFVDEAALPFSSLPGATAYWGAHAGAGYRIEVPNNWNGDLVLYAHGYRGERPDLFVSNPSIRQHLVARGYAWAASSYSANGYMPGTGAKDTHALLQRFNGLVGTPNRTYIAGHSMGGHVTGVAIEQWPKAFDGALPMCGVMGDSELFDYFQDVYLVGETLIGATPAIPTPADYQTNGVAALRAALGPNYPAVLNPTGLIFKEVIENLSGGQRPIFNQGWFGPFSGTGGNFILTQAGTGAGRENVDTIYQFDGDPSLSAEEQAFNDLIVRVAADPQFRREQGLGPFPGTRGQVNSPPISGDISIPVITLHTLGELFVPFSMEQIYARRVAAHGKSDLLVSRAIRDVNHCGFTAAEQVRAFDDLVDWVENGVQPAGDAILDPAIVAASSFGCAFTEGTGVTRSNLPVCP